MTEPERLKWHTGVYAFRRVYMGAPYDQHFWDGDPKREDGKGKYWNEALVDAETTRLLGKKASEQAQYAREKPFVFTDEELEERRQWAFGRGYEHWNAFLDAIHAGRESIVPFFEWTVARREEQYRKQYTDRVGKLRRLGTVDPSAPGRPTQQLKED